MQIKSWDIPDGADSLEGIRRSFHQLGLVVFDARLGSFCTRLERFTRTDASKIDPFAILELERRFFSYFGDDMLQNLRCGLFVE